MKRFLIIFIPLFLLATSLGVGGQDLAYWMQNHVYDMWPIYYVTIFCVISIVLYLIGIILLIVYLYKQKKQIFIYILGYLIIAGNVSFWSFIATVMWWG
ncbi:hypothetical protein SAMN05421663_11418 [Terribacillus halophilus]|uniref:Uncharacterized protein n=1 Tax=Terribacillus halophilus TaxID=361279 RepID=A0A1G6VUX4_9BACI|nr:hypothetical protein [Terribacillus halophilus]SDD57432.1 hypothetical protein SAMN05421663_11418 [Terribacillus halophilus]